MNPDLEKIISHITTPKREIFTQIFLVFITPILLIKLNILSIQYRIPVLIALVVLLMVILIREKWTWEMLGFSKKHIKHYLAPYAMFTFLGVAFIVFTHEIAGFSIAHTWWQQKHFLYMFLILSFLQEVAYRGYLMPALGKITNNPYWIIGLNTVLFTFLHIIYPNLAVGIPVALVGGLGFSLMYYKYPNLPLITISHSVLNFCAVLYGFFVISH